jgi:hypothetical protein
MVASVALGATIRAFMSCVAGPLEGAWCENYRKGLVPKN